MHDPGFQRAVEAAFRFFADGKWRSRRGARREENGALLDRLEAALGVSCARTEERRYGQCDKATFALDAAGGFVDAPAFAGMAAEADWLAGQGGVAHLLYLLLSDLGPFACIYGNTRRLDGARVLPAHFFADACPAQAAPAVARMRGELAALGLLLPEEATLGAPVRPHRDYPELSDTPADLRAHLFGEA